MPARNRPELRVNQRQEPLERAVIPLLPGPEILGDFVDGFNDTGPASQRRVSGAEDSNDTHGERPLIRLRHLLPTAVNLQWGEGYLFDDSREMHGQVAFSPPRREKVALNAVKGG
jgi:hypothetical protein